MIQQYLGSLKQHSQTSILDIQHDIKLRSEKLHVWSLYSKKRWDNVLSKTIQIIPWKQNPVNKIYQKRQAKHHKKMPFTKIASKPSKSEQWRRFSSEGLEKEEQALLLSVTSGCEMSGKVRDGEMQPELSKLQTKHPTLSLSRMVFKEDWTIVITRRLHFFFYFFLRKRSDHLPSHLSRINERLQSETC